MPWYTAPNLRKQVTQIENWNDWFPAVLMSDSPKKIASDPATWVDEHGDVLYRFALLRVKDPHVAEDLVQETFISALQGLDRFKGGSAIRTWLVGILKHKIIDHFRKSSQEVSATDLTFLTEETEEEAYNRLGMWKWKDRPRNWDDNPDNVLNNKEFWGVFTGCLEGLQESFRRAFALRELEGMKTDEICKILHITPTNLWVILHRARAKLRSCLEAKWFGGER